MDCESHDETNRLYKELLIVGKEMMSLGSYGFGEVFGWLTDKYGVSC
ncbi:MAG: VOC family protein [Bacteroidetes bacterium]|nr:VOC family protein [Bacteroidota bacterium]MBL6942864.1 VOC family protein [Bacteroidales bacterium]